MYNQVASHQVWMLVRLVLEREPRPFGHTRLHHQCKLCLLPHHLRSLARLARVADDLSFPSTPVAHALHLLEDTRREHVLHDPHPAATTVPALLRMSVPTPGPITHITDCALLDRKRLLSADIEVSQWDRDLDLYILAPALAASATEELREEIKGVVVLLTSAALLMFLQSVNPVAVVDLARLGVRERLVGFRHGAELVGSVGLVGVLVGVPFLGEGAVGALDVFRACIFVDF